MQELTISSGEMDSYLKELESVLLDSSSKRCALIAHAKAIKMLVDVVLAFKDMHPKLVHIDNITIGTVRSITMKRDRPKNVSFMKIVVAKQERLKE